MKLWKCAAIALTICGAALSVLRTRMAPGKTSHLLSRDSSSSSSRSSSPASSNASASLGIEHRRKRRSTEGANSVLSEFMDIFQSFTEGELKQVIGALVERKARRDASESKRTKRARKGARCSLQDQEVTVSQLELGYESDEIVLFRYCSGKCSASRRNYDITLASMKERLRGRREKVRHNPCCRPTSYEEDFAFLDNHNKYQTIKEWSASKCGCV